MNFLESILKTSGHIRKYRDCDKNVAILPEPEYVVIPLEYPGQVLYKPLVKQGDQVYKNQIIGRSKLDNCVHASVSGIVREIKLVWTARSFNVPAAVIETNDKPAMSVEEMFDQYGVSYSSASRVQKLKASGVISPWTTPGKFHHEEDVEGLPDVRHIVIKGVNEEPSVFVFELLIQQYAEKVARGFRQLKNIAPNAVMWLTVPKYLGRWAREQFGDSIKVKELPDDYRHRIERMIVPRVTGVRVPNTLSYRKLGVAVLSVEYLLTMVDAIDGNGPFVEKCATVAGGNLSVPVTVKFPLGTPIRSILKNRGVTENQYARILVGGPMKGNAQFSDETPLTKSSHGIFLLSREDIPEDINLTCISCGRCTRICPVNLQVHLIGRYAEYDMFDEARRYHPEACNECGLCAHLCPSRRPLVQLIKMCNQDLEHGNDRFEV